LNICSFFLTENCEVLNNDVEDGGVEKIRVPISLENKIHANMCVIFLVEQHVALLKSRHSLSLCLHPFEPVVSFL
jgi:hypothetical protein